MISSINILSACTLGVHSFWGLLFCRGIILDCTATNLAGRGTVTSVSVVATGKECTGHDGDVKSAL
jgi:hypothetical protein